MPELATAVAVHQDIFIVTLATHLTDFVIVVLIGILEEQ